MSKRPRKRLDREAILGAASRVVERRGLEALSMRALGRELGVEAMTLYHYFPSKDALLDALVGQLALEVVVPEPGELPWDEAARTIARSFRSVAGRYPRTAELLLLRRPPGEAVGRSEAAIAHLVEGGLDRTTAALAYRTLSAYTWGSLIEDRRTSPFTTGDRDAEFEFGLEAVLAGLQAMTRPHSSPPGRRESAAREGATK